MRALITGASGFAGRHLVSHCLEHGDEVTATGRRPEGESGLPGGVERYERAELADADGLRGLIRKSRPDAVYHLAAAASVARSWEDPRTALEANVLITLNVLEAARAEAPDAVVVLACSGEEYGPPQGLPVDERHPLRPQNPYAVAKASADLLGGLYADAHGLAVIRVRAFNHAGPGQGPTYVVSSFARQIADAEARGDERLAVRTGNLETRRDFTDVRDVVRAYRLLAERAEPDVYNVCSGRSVAVAELLSGLAALTPLALEQRTDPARVRAHEVPEVRGSFERLRHATGWQPEIELERTLRDALDWWRTAS